MFSPQNFVNVKAHLVWQRFFGEYTGDSDTLCACLGHLVKHDTARIISVCVTLPKVSKASKEDDIMLRYQ
jgi:hypothetical protein